MVEAAPNDRPVRGLTLALWIVATAFVAAYTVGVVANRHVVRSGVIVEAFESYPFSVGAAAIGALAARKRPANPVGWMLLLFALVLSTNLAVEQYAIHGLLGARPHWPGARLAAWIQQWGTFLFFPYPMTLMFLLFPDGRLASRRFLPVVWFIAAFCALSVVSAMLVQGPVLTGCCNQRLLVRNPLGVPGFGLLQGIGFVGVLVALPFAAGALVRKARMGGDEVRHQVRWLAYVIGLAAVAFAAAVVAGLVAGFGQAATSGPTNALFGTAIFIIALG